MGDNGNKPLRVLAMVDCASSSLYDYDTGREYDDMDCMLSLNLGLPVKVVRDTPPGSLSQSAFDMYVFDYGGMLPGSEDFTASLYRDFIRAADDHPGAAFVLYSRFSERWYSELVRSENPELSGQENVFFAGTPDCWDDVREWLSIEAGGQEMDNE
jgi:hypothetical protein